MQTYQPRYPANTEILDVRGISYAVHSWGNPENAPVFLLHGWADTGWSFQFLAEELADDYFLLAPDWRGFGDSQWAPGGYWFPDYLADLDYLLDHYAPRRKSRLVGHSMGGNVACLYAGIRPDRITHLASLDVFGLPATDPAMAPSRYKQWLDQLQEIQSFSEYPHLEALIERINRLAPGLAQERAAYIASSWCREAAPGRPLTLKADPAHKRVNPVLYRREEALRCWRAISAKTLFVYGRDSRFYTLYRNEGYRDEFVTAIQHFTDHVLEGAGHMLHMQKPGDLASCLKRLFAS